jgi:hypothetical protein
VVNIPAASNYNFLFFLLLLKQKSVGEGKEKRDITEETL